MIEEDKHILIAKMIDDPHALTDAEINAILCDEELRQIYEVSSKVRGACLSLNHFNVEEEWQRFRPDGCLPSRRISTWRRLRIAALFTGIVAVSAMILYVVDGTLQWEKRIGITACHQSPESSYKTLKDNDVPDSVNPAAAEKSDKRKSSPNKKSYIHPSPSCRNLISDQNEALELIVEEIDVDEYLRIQQAKIDNDLAVHWAENFKAELDIMKDEWKIDSINRNLAYIKSEIYSMTIE